MDNWIIPDAIEIDNVETNYFTYYLTSLLQYFKVTNPYSFDIVHGWLPKDVDYHSDMVIHDVSYAPYLRNSIAHNTTKPIVYLSGEYGELPSGWVHFPFWFAIVRMSKFSHQFTVPVDSVDRPYKFSCLNKSPKAERIWFYCQLHKSELFKESLTTFYPTETTGKQYVVGNRIDLEKRYYSNHDDIDQDTLDYFITNIFPTLPHCISEEREKMESDPQFFTHGIDHPAFSDAYINIVSEHLYQRPYLSEKTVKPLAAQQLFLMAGPSGAVEHLERMGFDTYSDIIDHGYYDSETDWQLRMKKMLAVAEDINRQDIKSLHISTDARRIRNREYLFSMEFQESLYIPLKKWVDLTFKV